MSPILRHSVPHIHRFSVYQYSSQQCSTLKKYISIYIVILLFHIFINSEHFSMHLQNILTSSSDHPGSHSMHYRVLSQGKSGQGMMLTTHLHPAARLRMSAALLYSPSMTSWCGQTTNFTFPSNVVHDLVCLSRNAKATTKHAVTCTYTAYCCIWLKYTVTWKHATWCSNTPVPHQHDAQIHKFPIDMMLKNTSTPSTWCSNTPAPHKHDVQIHQYPMSLDCNQKISDMKQDMFTTKNTEQIWSQLHSLTFHFHCCRQLCLSKCISSNNCVGSSILWTYTQDINGNITKIMVCLDPVGTLDSFTIEVPFNLDGEENVLPITDFSTVTSLLILTCLEYDRGMKAMLRNYNCVTAWQLCYAMTAVLWHDSCVTEWPLCYGMTAVLLFNITMIKIWQCSKTVLPVTDWSYKIKAKIDTESQIQ